MHSQTGGEPRVWGGSSGDSAPDRFAAARAVADAVLYEGYVLYPYRASAPKNQLRWQFGVLTPQAFSEADASERSWLRTECLAEASPASSLSVRIRCLHAQHRAVEAAAQEASAHPGGFAPVDTLEIEGNVYVDWDEAVDRVVDLPPLALTTLLRGAHEERFRFTGGSEAETIRRHTGAVAGRLVRTRQAVEGLARVEVSATGDRHLLKVAVTVQNLTRWTGPAARRDDVLGHSLVAVHVMLALEHGIFVSLLDPPPSAAAAVADCHNDGVFPVLIGPGDVVLASPIILYDRPEVAPESPGDLYDATEIDEILALRVLTLTDEEKSEARGTDSRAAAIIDRCDQMPPEIWSRLHGAVRGLGPLAADTPPGAWQSGDGAPVGAAPPAQPEAVSGDDPMAGEAVPWWDPSADATVDPGAGSVLVAGVEVRSGTRVRLQPSRRADAHDLFLRGMTATVAGVFEDVDGSRLVAVTIDDDPAREELAWQGRYLYFHPDEIIPLAGPGPR